MVSTHVEQEDQFLHLHMSATSTTITSQHINNIFSPLVTTGGSTSAHIAVQLSLPEHLPINLLKGWVVLLAAKGSFVVLTRSSSTSLLPSLVEQVVGGGLCPATG